MIEIIELNDKNFEENINSSNLISVVDFYSDSCPPCKALEPVFAKLAETFAGKAKFFRFNVDKNSLIPSSIRIIGIPTIVIFKEGKEVERITGFLSLESLSEFLRRNL